jgi:hypothetical protein
MSPSAASTSNDNLSPPAVAPAPPTRDEWLDMAIEIAKKLPIVQL